MDTTVVPSVNTFEVVIAGTPYVPTSVGWIGPDTLNINYPGPAGPAVATLNQIAFDPACRGFDHVLSWSPQTIDFNIL